MGFGKKTDHSTGKTLDLDQTYKNIIKPAIEDIGFECVRADEIQESGLIDKSMYALLMHADLVVADISTYNPNAIYELGVRHAVRPYSTIIIKEEEGKIPFDLDHNRIFHYTHLGDDIGADEAVRCQNALKDLIRSVSASKKVDSPLYDFINDIEPPKLTNAEYKRIIGELSEREDRIFAISERARHLMEEGEFEDAAKLWEKAEKTAPTEQYFTQQRTLAIYKSKKPTEFSALSDALQVIEKLNPDGETNDPETLGLTGAIYKRLWQTTEDREYLSRAISYYGKGFQIRRDYYNGENYALCLNFASSVETVDEERTYFEVSARKTREKLVVLLLELIGDIDEISADDKWPCATLANCYFGLRNSKQGERFERIFLSLCEVQWEKDTYFESKKSLLDLIGE